MALAARDGGPVLVPAEQDAPVQVVDVGDLARWLVDAGAAGLAGAFDAVGPRRTLRAGARGRADGGRLHRAAGPGAVAGGCGSSGVEEFMGPRSLPLWLADPDWAGFSARSGAAASAAGLSPGPWPT